MTTSSNELLFNLLVAHQIDLLRYSAGLRDSAWQVLKANEKQLLASLYALLELGNALTTVAEWRAFESNVAEVLQSRIDAWSKVSDLLEEDLQGLINNEVQFLASALIEVVPVVISPMLPPARQLNAILTVNPFSGSTLAEWAERMKDADLRRIRSEIQSGMIEGEGMDAIARRIFGTKDMQGLDGVAAMSFRDVSSVVRTGVMHIANVTRARFAEANSDIFTEEQFVATLDARTTAVCRANDSKRFPIGSGPQPPLHIACRSLRIPIIDGILVGNRPFKAASESRLREEFAKNGRGSFEVWSRKRARELIGQVPAGTSYEEWLRKQPRSFQEDVLGKTKAKLFADGKLPLDKFIDRVGNELTLKELAKRQPGAFELAGLNVSKYLD